MLDDLTTRGLGRPELVVVDGGKGQEGALASLWDDVPVQRCTVHKGAQSSGPCAAAPARRDQARLQRHGACRERREGRRQAQRSSWASGSCAVAPSPTVWRRLVSASSRSCATRPSSGARSGRRMPSSDCTRSSSAGSRPSACCSAPRPLPCSSGPSWRPSDPPAAGRWLASTTGALDHALGPAADPDHHAFQARAANFHHLRDTPRKMKRATTLIHGLCTATTREPSAWQRHLHWWGCLA